MVSRGTDIKNNNNKPDIPEFYNSKCVFITGATGFMGKILVEKLMRSCPNIGTLYLLMRPKRGKTPEERLHEIVSNSLFNSLKTKRSEESILKQLKVVEGDVSKLGLGISSPSRLELTENVSIVFHAAASVKFDESLRDAILLNTRGTREIIALCKEMKNIQALVHVSTMFSNCHDKHITEDIDFTTVDSEKLIQCAEWMDENWLTAFTPMILGGRPNTYVYSKSLAEKLMHEASKNDLPVGIFRPSIVMSTLNEPEPGWLENLNGPSVIIMSASTGMISSIYCHEDKVAHIAPADMCINVMISLAWYIANYKPNKCEAFNFTAPKSNEVSWKLMAESVRRCYKENPFTRTLFTPNLILTNSRLRSSMCQTYYLLWAHIIDIFKSLTGTKKQIARVLNKINSGVSVLEPFSTQTWNVDTNNVNKLLSCLKENDKKTFDFDLNNVDFKQYLYDYTLGVRRHVMKDEDNTIKHAQRKLKIMKFTNRSVKSALFILLVYFFLPTNIISLQAFIFINFITLIYFM